MRAADDDTGSAHPALRRLIAPWEYRHLRPWAATRMAAGLVSAGLGVYVISETWPGPWTIFGAYLVAAGAANVSFACCELPVSAGSRRP